MIQKITSLTQNLNKIAHSKEFNNTLPILLKILKKEGKDLYSIKIGNITQQTKSLKELQVGARYFATISKSSTETTLISNLTPYPKGLNSLMESAPLRLKSNELKTILQDDKTLNQWKDHLIQEFLTAQNKSGFLFYGNMLLGLQKNIFNFIVDENAHQKILQIKTKKNLPKLEFYALFPNLGGISGFVWLEDQQLHLSLQTQFRSVQTLLQRNINQLKAFERIEIIYNDNLSPLFCFEDHLLNLKI